MTPLLQYQLSIENIDEKGFAYTTEHVGYLAVDVDAEIAALRSQLAQVTAERDSFQRVGIATMEQLEHAREDFNKMIRTHDAYVAVAEAHEEVLTRERDRYRELLEGTP